MKQTFDTEDEALSAIDDLYNKETSYVIDMQELDDNAGFTVNWQEHKMYTAMDGKEYPEEYWITKNCEMIQVQDIPLEHLRNILRQLLRNDREMIDMADEPNNMPSMCDDTDDEPTVVQHTLH